MSRVKVVVLIAAFAVGCRFPELPALDGDASMGLGDASSDGPGSGGPNVVITKGPAANSTTGPRVTYEFTVRDGSPYCRFDDKPLTPCTSPLSVNLPAGAHTFHVQAENSGGTVDSDSRLWTVSCSPRQGTNDTFGLFHFDEGSGTIAVNAHPFKPPPTVRDLILGDPPNDPSWTSTGRFGGAVRFSAVGVNDGDYMHGGGILDPQDAMSLGAHSVEMWLKPAPTFAHDLQLLSVGGGNQLGRMDYYLTFRKTGTHGNYILEARGENLNSVVTSQSVPLGVYHYVAMSFAPGTKSLLFVDGQAFETSIPINGTVEMWSFYGFSPFEGDLDELHMTFHRYTQEELLDLWCPQ